VGALGAGGAEAQEGSIASAPSSNAVAARVGTRLAPGAPLESRATEQRHMWVIVLEAAGVLLLVLFFVWWTMRGKK
jgi:hypothetical protein